MSSTDLYKEAHNIHYKDGDFSSAQVAYQRIIDEYPGSAEAGYADTQLRNIAKTLNPQPADFSTREPEDLEGRIRFRFECSRCEGKSCVTKRLALAGAGAARLFDVQNNFYLAVACQDCGSTEFYDLNVLEGRGGIASAVLDLLFGK